MSDRVGPKIRDLNDAERALRAKWAAKLRESEAAVRTAVAAHQHLQEVVNDIALAIGGGPVALTAGAVHEIAKDGD